MSFKFTKHTDVRVKKTGNIGLIIGRIREVNPRVSVNKYEVIFGHNASGIFEEIELEHVRHAKQESTITLPPGVTWQPGIDATTPEKKCTCGIAAIGGGMHSDWCDLYDKNDIK